MSKSQVSKKMTKAKWDSRGGRFEIKDGIRVRVDDGTQDHAEGNSARAKDGSRIATDGKSLKSPLKNEVTHGA